MYPILNFVIILLFMFEIYPSSSWLTFFSSHFPFPYKEKKKEKEFYITIDICLIINRGCSMET
jgi:hypothetical protein